MKTETQLHNAFTCSKLGEGVSFMRHPKRTNFAHLSFQNLEFKDISLRAPKIHLFTRRINVKGEASHIPASQGTSEEVNCSLDASL